jgi:predicted nucleic acid-binding protein
MIYLDSSVALAVLFTEMRAPPREFWRAGFVASRLLEYEVMNRVHAQRLDAAKVAAARQLIESVELVELTPAVLARALAPFPLRVRTLDALHLATMVYLREQQQDIVLATYDERLAAAAAALGFAPARL